MKLRTQQKQIIGSYKGGYMAIPAVPGAGKTTTLANMAAELIDKGDILIVTFTNTAVGNFKAKIRELLKEQGKNPQKGYEVKTLHSLALNILAERPELMGLGADIETIDEARQDNALNRITTQWINAHYDEWENPIRENIKNLNSGHPHRRQSYGKWRDQIRKIAKEMIKTFKMKGITPEWIVEKTKDQRIALRWFAEIYQLYQRELINKGLIDYDDMILKARDLLKSDAYLLEALRSRWTYILEDEAQDSNPVQEQILYLLAGEDGNLIRVGDSNQAIMGTFTNSDPSLFRNYCRRGDVQRQELSVSGRSTGDIIDLANYLVDWSLNTDYSESLEDLKIEPVPPGEPGPNPLADNYLIDYEICNTSREEPDVLAQKAAQYVNENPGKTVGILVPFNSMTAPMVSKVREYGVECREITNEKTESEKYLDDIINILKYLSRPHRNDLFWNALKGLVPGADIPELEEYIKKEVKLEELLYPVETIDIPAHIKSLEVWPGILGWMEQFKTWLSCCHFPAEDLILLIADGLNLESEQLAVADKVAHQARLIQESNLGFKLAEISEELQFQINDFSVFSHKLADRNGFEPEPGEVNVITYHKAKGMEWDAVFLSSLTGYYFPCTENDNFMSELYYLQEDKKNPAALLKRRLELLLEEKESEGLKPMVEAKREQISERRRLLYVALTRARKKLYLSAFKKTVFESGNKKDAGPCESFKALMQFIDERRNSR